MPQIITGCGPIPTSRKQYFETFGALELSESWHEPLGTRALRQWREQAGPEFVFVLHAWRWLTLDPLDERTAPPNDLARDQVGLLQPSDANRGLWAEVDRQARDIGAQFVLLRTPPTFSPSDHNRANLRRFLEEIVGDDVPYQIAWEPRGLWEPEDALDVAEEHGLVLARDPWADFEMPEPLGGDVIYTLTAPRGRRTFDNDDYEELLDFVDEHDDEDTRVVLLFRGPERERNAQRLLTAQRQRGDNG